MSVAFLVTILFHTANPEGQVVGQHTGSGTIEITPVSTIQVDFTGGILGLSFDDDGWPRLMAISEVDQKLYGLEPITADSVDELSLHPGNQSAWGVAWYAEDLIFTNDTGDTSLFGYDSQNWFTQPNAAETNGRGMDCNGDLFWQAVIDGTIHCVVSWDPMSGIWTWSDISAYVTGQLSGLAAFTLGSTDYLAVTAFNDPQIWVFTTNDRKIGEYIGSAALPETADISNGLTHSTTFNTFYWSYTSGGSTYISMFEMTIDPTPLQRNSWGGIKAGF